MKISPFAGELAQPSDLIDLNKLLQAYENLKPDPMIDAQRVHFGTSGHRGSSLDATFNRDHILAIGQAICFYRKLKNISGPLFLGFDSHALSKPAFQTILEVLVANGVNVMIASNHEFTPTPVISHAIIKYNLNRFVGLADGIIITPSHKPPQDGGIKYNPIHGGPAEKAVTDWIELQANEILKNRLVSVQRTDFEQAMRSSTTHLCDFIHPYVHDLENIIDMKIIRDSKITIGVDPLGGAGIHYWEPIADYYKINLTLINKIIDPSFHFINRDWDGEIRMDPSSSYTMQSLVQMSEKFDISFACDTDNDRHGIVTKSAGLMPANDYLAVAIWYLFNHRPQWPKNLSIGKTLVSSQMIDRVANSLGRDVYEVPVGFKWFVEGLSQNNSIKLGFAGEESAGASFLRLDGSTWTTDKDGFTPALLAAEMKARLDKDPAEIYQGLTHSLGNPIYKRSETHATQNEKKKLKDIVVADIKISELGGETIEKILNHAPGNNAPIGGIKIETKNGWVALRPSGTEDLKKIYAESFLSEEHLNRLITDANKIVKDLNLS